MRIAIAELFFILGLVLFCAALYLIDIKCALGTGGLILMIISGAYVSRQNTTIKG